MEDDAAVYKLREDLAVIATVDYFTPIVKEAYMYGQIAAANALSDVYAMGGKPITAMNIVCFPAASMDLSMLAEVLRGGADKLKEAHVALVGGHSVIDPKENKSQSRLYRFSLLFLLSYQSFLLKGLFHKPGRSSILSSIYSFDYSCSKTTLFMYLLCPLTINTLSPSSLCPDCLFQPHRPSPPIHTGAAGYPWDQ
jgi:hypothetical protein